MILNQFRNSSIESSETEMGNFCIFQRGSLIWIIQKHTWLKIHTLSNFKGLSVGALFGEPGVGLSTRDF